jgi:hypothetical protein
MNKCPACGTELDSLSLCPKCDPLHPREVLVRGKYLRDFDEFYAVVELGAVTISVVCDKADVQPAPEQPPQSDAVLREHGYDPDEIRRLSAIGDEGHLTKLLAKHPLPWTAQHLMVVDAKGKQVIHVGGTQDSHGRTMDGYWLTEINKLTVKGANARQAPSPRRTPAVEALESAVTYLETEPLYHEPDCSYGASHGPHGDFCDCGLAARRNKRNQVFKKIRSALAAESEANSGR